MDCAKGLTKVQVNDTCRSSLVTPSQKASGSVMQDLPLVKLCCQITCLSSMCLSTAVLSESMASETRGIVRKRSYPTLATAVPTGGPMSRDHLQHSKLLHRGIAWAAVRA